MKTISIVKKDFNSVVITVDGVESKLTVMSFNTYAGVGDVCCLCISSANKKYELNLDPSVDAITIGETLFDGTGAQLAAALDDHLDQDLSVSQVVIYQRKTILTDAQIKALPTTFIEVVPAAGEGKMVLLHNALIRSNQTAGVYTNVDTNTNMFIAFSDEAGGWQDHASNPFIFLSASSDRFAILSSPISAYTIAPNSDIMPPYIAQSFTNSFNNVGLVLVIDNAGDLTGGNAANTLEVTVFYSIVDL